MNRLSICILLTLAARCPFLVNAEITEVKSTRSHVLRTNIPGRSNNNTSHLRQKRQEMEPYFPEYPDTVDFSDYPEQNPNYLAPLGIAGGAGLALKAAKTKAKLKGLKLLAVPAGIALLGGIAALASGVIPPAVIGGINLPFQGKRRKRNVKNYYEYKIPYMFERKLKRMAEDGQKMFSFRKSHVQ